MKRILLIIWSLALFAACSDNEKAASDLTVIPSLIEFDNTESVQKIHIGSNTAWKTASTAEEWCTVSILQKFGNDTAEIRVVENTAYYERIAYVSFSNPENTIVRTVKVIQKSLGRQMFREDDSLTLVKFYDATGGDQWTDNTGWKTSSLENWYGVVIKNDRVTGIKFDSNNLSGALIPELGELAMLDTLSIVSEKDVTGSIPVAIADLPNLAYLNISGTSVSGNIPPQLGNLAALEELILSENPNVTGTVPAELGNLVNLKKLDINSLPATDKSIPAELGNLVNLKYLALDSCNLNGAIPGEIFGLTNLEYLSLNNNKLGVDFPVGVTALTKLKHLILSGNNFLGTIPEELADLELVTLRLENNYLSGTIPDGILSKIDGNLFSVCPQKFDFPSFGNHECQ
ncbi:MAG: leucine-rich repeat domain-containing protein [Prevotellaceae bacterium]|jgi:hypothetical protein|nr:leucine-rich repeat domain-containing protein [Prevotellaceae bacterium]